MIYEGNVPYILCKTIVNWPSSMGEIDDLCLIFIYFIPSSIYMGGFESRHGLGIFLFTTTSRPVLGPT